MSTRVQHDRPTIAPAVQTVLGDLRRRVRRYIWLEGCAAAVIWLGAAFWATLAVDWFFEPTAPVRGFVLISVGAALMGILWQMIVRRAWVRITDGNLANVLERRFPQLQDSLLTAVALTEGDGEPCDAEMFARSCREAETRLATLEYCSVFNYQPLRQKYLAAGTLALSVAMFVVLLPGDFGVWARRTLAFSEELWPRNARLEVDGFAGGVQKIARGSDIEVIARADTSMPVTPQVVEVRYRTEGGNRGRATMDRRGVAHPPEDRFQEYAYTFRSVLGDVYFDIVGGDDRVANLRIQAVDSPTISRMTLECRWPDYTRRGTRMLPVSGVMQVPLGSRITVHAAEANKDLVEVQVGALEAERSQNAHLQEPVRLAPDHRGFSLDLPPLMRDTTLLFTLTDADGIWSRDPVRLALTTLADESPRMDVRLDGIGAAVTPQARVPVVGRIADDYGIDRVWFEYAKTEQPPTKWAIAQFSDGREERPTELPLTNTALEWGDLGAKPGETWTFCVKAADGCELTRGPNVASGERWTLDVVTPEQLRAMLESRELVLRQRFDRMIEETTEMRDVLARLEWGEESVEKKEDERLEEDLQDQPPSSPAPLPQAGDGRLLRIEGAIANSRKSAQEVLGLAEAFDDIRKQLVNNRIDTEELKERLQKGIAEPLRTVTDPMFPELERRLEELRTAASDASKAPNLRDRARQQADEILLAMRKIRDRMIELEDFNEAIDLLRSIIQGQQELRERTQERHKQKIRDLLKD